VTDVREGGRHVRVLARRVRDLSTQVGLLADRVGSASGVGWASPAATAYRRHVAAERGHLLAAGALLDDAVEALLRHATALDTVAASPVLPAWPPGLTASRPVDDDGVWR
jgi:hypothetical protein